MKLAAARRLGDVHALEEGLEAGVGAETNCPARGACAGRC